MGIYQVVSKVPLNMNRDIGQFYFGNMEQVLQILFHLNHRADIKWDLAGPQNK